MPELTMTLDTLKSELLRLGYPDPAMQLDISPGTHPVEVRGRLEMFFAHTASLSPDITGVRFIGNNQAFGKLREFVRERGWLTRAEECVVRSFYGLLSDSAHQAVSLIESNMETALLRYVIGVVIFRLTSEAR